MSASLDYLQLVAAFIAAQSALELYLDYRQHLRYADDKVPSEVAEHFDAAEYKQAQKYGKAKSSFGLLESFFGLLWIAVVLYYDLIPKNWQLAGRLMKQYLGYDADAEIVQSLIFLAVYRMVSMVKGMPFTLYRMFVIEEKFGFNKQTLGGFFVDLIKGLGLQIALGVPIVSVLLMLIKWGGDNLWIYCWAFAAAVTLFFMTIYPIFIMPLFNKFEELPKGELRDQIAALAKRVDFPLTQMFTMDASKRSSHSNAFFVGLFNNKRIVLFDTLLEQVDTEGIVAIIGHEMGHYKLNHLPKNLTFVQLYLAAFLYLFGQAMTNTAMFQSFGFFNEKPALIGLVLFSLLYGPVDAFFSFIQHAMSRQFEYEADQFALELGLSLESPLAKIHKENKASLNPDPWWSAYHLTHPTLVERIRAMRAFNAKKK